MSERPTPETDALECAFALLKCSPIGSTENSSEYGRAAYRLSKHCQGSEDVSEAAMRIFAERIAELERERDEAREQANVMHEQWLSKGRCCENLAEELHEVKQQRDKAIARSKEWSDWCVQYMTERNEAREALMKIKEIFIDGGDTYVDFVKVGNIATDYLEGLWK